MISITIYPDGNPDEYGYKYIVQRGACAWTAFRTDNGFLNFLKVFNLKINPACTRVIDMRHRKGRVITTACHEKVILDGRYYTNMDEIPEGAKHFIGLSNGNYVDCYIHDTGDKAVVYRANPNYKDVYKPYDYHEMRKIIG